MTKRSLLPAAALLAALALPDRGHRAGRALLDLRLRARRPADRGDPRRRGRGSLRHLLQPRGAGADRRAALPLRPHLDRARARSRPPTRPARTSTSTASSSTSCPRSWRATSARTTARRTTSLSRSCPATTRTGTSATATSRSSAASPDGSAGFGRVRERVVEYWVGGTWSHRVRKDLSFGVSPFVAYRAQRSRRSLTLEELAAGASSALFVAKENEYNHGRLLAKAGVAWRPGRWELGATVTTPGIGPLRRRQGRLQRVSRGRGVGAASSPRARRRGSTSRTTPRGRSRAARPGAAAGPRSTRRSSGSRRSPPTTSSPRSPPPSRAARPPSRSSSRVRARAS